MTSKYFIYWSLFTDAPWRHYRWGISWSVQLGTSDSKLYKVLRKIQTLCSILFIQSIVIRSLTCNHRTTSRFVDKKSNSIHGKKLRLIDLRNIYFCAGSCDAIFKRNALIGIWIRDAQDCSNVFMIWFNLKFVSNSAIVIVSWFSRPIGKSSTSPYFVFTNLFDQICSRFAFLFSL